MIEKSFVRDELATGEFATGRRGAGHSVPLPHEACIAHVLPRIESMARRLHERRRSGGAWQDLMSDAQEGLLAAARSFDASRGVPFGAWATRRARGRMLDGLRSERARARHASRWAEVAAAVTDAACAPASPEEAFAAGELQRLVKRAMEELPALERALLEGVYEAGTDLDDAARTLGISKSWGSRVHGRALAELRRRVGRLTADAQPAPPC